MATAHWAAVITFEKISALSVSDKTIKVWKVISSRYSPDENLSKPSVLLTSRELKERTSCSGLKC